MAIFLDYKIYLTTQLTQKCPPYKYIIGPDTDNISSCFS